MVRAYHINGETMVSVKGGHPGLLALTQLGLASDSIDIYPTFFEQGKLTDDFGPHVPAEIMRMLAWVDIEMTLVHYDIETLAALMTAMLGVYPTDGSIQAGAPLLGDGTCGGAGVLMGKGLAVGTANNLFTSVNLLSAVPTEVPWRFYACSLSEQPVKYPIGTKHSLVHLVFRAIPYMVPNEEGEWISEGAVIFDHIADT